MKKIMLLLTLLFSIDCHSDADQRWLGIRDGVFHIKVLQEAVVLRLEWKDAWQADANEDWVILQGQQGQEIETLRLNANSISGSREWRLPPSRDPYRLEIAGYSFRYFNVITDAKLPMVFEPVKHHFGMSIPGKCCFYFNKTAKTLFLGAKYHGGASTLALRSTEGKTVKKQKIQKFSEKNYPRNTLISLNKLPNNTLWGIAFDKVGKVGFWLDGDHNYFSLSPETWFMPRYDDAKASITINTSATYPAAYLGVAVPHVVPPITARKKIANLGVHSISSYLFVDGFARNMAMNQNLRKVYADLGIRHDIAILSATGRAHKLEASHFPAKEMRQFFEKNSVDNINLSLSLADEPNLNYSNFKEFDRYFTSVVANLKGTNIALAYPLSSRFSDGPTRDNAKKSKGSLWLKKQLQKDSRSINVIAWNEWLVRDLYATPKYKTSIETARTLERQYRGDGAKKPLIIAQTNISSGLHLSPYEQSTFFAALWWASVVINASQDGQLHSIHWFKLVDDKEYPKGLFTTYPEMKVKPVADMMTKLGRYWRPQVVASSIDSIDIESLIWQGNDDLNLVMLNKSPRRYIVDLENFLIQGKVIKSEIIQTSKQASGIMQRTKKIELPPQSLALIQLKVEK